MGEGEIDREGGMDRGRALFGRVDWARFGRDGM